MIQLQQDFVQNAINLNSCECAFRFDDLLK